MLYYAIHLWKRVTHDPNRAASFDLDGWWCNLSFGTRSFYFTHRLICRRPRSDIREWLCLGVSSVGFSRTISSCFACWLAICSWCFHHQMSRAPIPSCSCTGNLRIVRYIPSMQWLCEVDDCVVSLRRTVLNKRTIKPFGEASNDTETPSKHHLWSTFYEESCECCSRVPASMHCADT